MKTRNLFFVSLLFSLVFLLTSCASDSGSGNGRCDIVANPNSDSFLQIRNNLSSGLEWNFVNSYAFGADMKPGECVIMGVASTNYLVDFTRCNIADSACISSFGATKRESFFVDFGTTYSIEVDNAFFN